MSPSSLLLTWSLVAATLLLLVLNRARKRAHETKRRLPPGPRALPIIGHIHLLSPRPYREMSHLAATYGPVMLLRMGTFRSIIISSPAAVEELFKSHDLAIAGRPLMQAGEILNYKSSTLAITQYGPYWRAMRKLLTSEYFSTQKIESFAPIRTEELRLFIADLRLSTAPIDMTANISHLIMKIACRMVLGIKLKAEEVREYRGVLKDGATFLSTLNIVDFVPFVGRLGLDLQGLKGKMFENKRDIKGLTRKIEARIDGVVGEGRTLIDAMVAYMQEQPDREEFGFNRNHIKAHIMDAIATTVEPTQTTIGWAFVELLRHPDIMKKLQQELTDVVGTDRLIEESDLPKLPYLEMVIKESMRLHTPIPLLIPHMALEDFTIQGFDVPRGSHVIVNAWALSQDATVWPEPERFWPERFEGSKVDFKGHNFEFIPFGTGRRICAGMQLGISMVRLVLAQLVHCFDWKMPEGMKVEDLSMEEFYSISAPRAENLVAVPIYRLNCEV